MNDVAITEPEKLQFKVSSGLKSVIGRDLITDDFVAIFELVKNSADAGATQIDVIYEPSPNRGKIYIVDNGKGMSRYDIEEKWLFVAYSAKQDGSEDHAEKVYAGNKGIGRFSCDRLGSSLNIQTKRNDGLLVESLEVDWGKFEENSKDWFSDINILYRQQTEFKLPTDILRLEHGTIIEVSELRAPDSWDRNKLISLKRSLAKLVDPFGDSNSKIKINIHAASEKSQDTKVLATLEDGDINRSQIVNGAIDNPILDLLNTKTTTLEVKLEKGFFCSSLIDRGELIYRIREKNQEFSHLNDTSFAAKVYFLNRSSKQTFSIRMGTPSVRFGSIFLFRNGFRVYPVGEQGDDYWGLNFRKQQGTSRYLGGRDVLGRVDIQGPETKFKEASSRDLGLVKTPASEELKEVLLSKVIRRLEAYVVGVTWADALDKDYENTERMYLDDNRARIIALVSKLAGSKDIELLEYNTNLVSVLNEKSKHFETTITKLADFAESSNNKQLIGLVKDAQERFEVEKKRSEEARKQADAELEARRAAEARAREEEAKREEAEAYTEQYKEELEKEKKRNLFLTISESRDKDQLESFIHQLIIYAAATKDLLHDEIFMLSAEDGNVDKQRVLDVLSEVLENNERIITTSRFATTADFMLDSAQIEDDLVLYIKEYATKIITSYNRKIRVVCADFEESFITRFSPIEIGLVLDNLVANAQKANAPTVTIKMKLDMKDVLVVEVEDNGRGLSSSITDPDRIFEKGYTTTDGSGLGLYNARQRLEDMGGEIVLASEQPSRGTRFLIRMKK
ncbi:MAG: ATP-binding protein [Neptuniibacter sp.]